MNFPKNLLATEPQRIFAISLTVLQILVGNEGHPKVPNGEKAAFQRNSGYECRRWNKKLSYCWETVRRESMLRIAEMDVEMTT